MRRLAIIVLLIFFHLTMFAQDYSKLIEKGKYSKVIGKCDKKLLKDPIDMESLYFSAVIKCKRESGKYFNPEEAYSIFLKASSLYYEYNDQIQNQKIDKIPINNEVLIALGDSIFDAAFILAEKVNTEDVYVVYLNKYSKATSFYKSKAINERNRLAYATASELNTIESYNLFISKYPDAMQADAAWKNIYDLAYQNCLKQNTIESYKGFITTYPNASQVEIANLKIHELAFEAAEKANTIIAFKEFIENYPNSIQYNNAVNLYDELVFSKNTKIGEWLTYKLFIEDHPSSTYVNAAKDSIYFLADYERNIEALKYCITIFTGDKKKSALIRYHDIFTEDGEKTTLDLFYENYDDEIFEEIKIKDYELAENGDMLFSQQEFSEDDYYKYDSYIKEAAPNERAFVALQRMISRDIKNKKWKKAIETIENYKIYFYNNIRKVDNLLILLKSQYDLSIKIQQFGPEINTEEGGEYTPVISADNKYIYFCGRNRNDNIGGEDIFRAKLKGKQDSEIMTELSTSYDNDAPLGISTDGTSFMVFKNGKILIADKMMNGWTIPTELEGDLNSGIWQADAMISSDGNALIFSSIRQGNYDYYITTDPKNYHGEPEYASDIYVCLKNDNGEWGKAINIGKTINTLYCDRSPFLHPDMKTLYFSSSGHSGLGGLDVFKATRLSDTCWTCWTEPINLGKEINTNGRDWGYKISTDGQTAYFSKNSNGYNTEDLYSFNLPPHLRPDFVARVEGKIKNSENKPISTTIHWEDLESNKVIGTSKTDPVDGSYFIVLPMGKNYGYFIEDSSYFPISKNLDLRNEKNAVEVSNDIVGITFNDMIEKSIAVPMNNLFFDYNKYNLLPSSKPELVRIASIIKRYNLKIEIAGHTDDVGDDKSNVTLSEKRANAVREFLIGQGCSASLLQTVGYGESKPIVDNDTDENRAKNRRVELRFIK